MPGSHYRLGKATRAIRADDGVKGFVLIPEGAVLVLDSLDGTGRLVKVIWGSQSLVMFYQDLLERSIEIEEVTAPSARAASDPF
jgi:hypothetical protein